MDNRKEIILAYIDQALVEHERLAEYASYAPIYNSGSMLEEMKGYVSSEYLPPTEIINEFSEWNVGLLAAKALDFDSRFDKYAFLLHDVWDAFLNFLQRPRQIPMSGDMKDAYYFYVMHGSSFKEAFDHLQGIDFGSGKDFDAKYMLKKHTNLVQWKASSKPQGDYYAGRGTVPDCLGIHTMQGDDFGNIFVRKKHVFALANQVIVLKSTAASVLDTWSIKGCKFKTKGGCIQYFNANDKKEFIQISP